MDNVSSKKMKNKRNYYRILHVQPDAPVEIVQSSYRTLMQKLKAHPGLGGEEWNATIINQAYQVLKDDKMRKEYDAELFRKKANTTLGVQHKGQRQEAVAKPGTDEWTPFRATVIDDFQ